MINEIICFFHDISPELIQLGQLFLSWIFIALFLKTSGKMGLASYVTVAIFIANLQLFIYTTNVFDRTPMAMGTAVFSSVFMATDLCAELYGRKAAQKLIMVGFLSMQATAILMLSGLATQPVSEAALNLSQLEDMRSALIKLFVPLPGFFIASIIAFVISQFVDVRIFLALKNLTSGRFLALRTIVAMVISSFIDGVVFSALAWRVFSSNPLPWDVIWTTYILSVYWIRLAAVVLSVPGMYIMRHFFAPPQKQSLL